MRGGFSAGRVNAKKGQHPLGCCPTMRGGFSSVAVGSGRASESLATDHDSLLVSDESAWREKIVTILLCTRDECRDEVVASRLHRRQSFHPAEGGLEERNPVDLPLWGDDHRHSGEGSRRRERSRSHNDGVWG